MRDLGVLFSAPMIRAMIAGKKDQTRRLSSSPLARLERGDRIWVREAWRVSAAEDHIRAGELEPAPAGVLYPADDRGPPVAGRLRAGMHMTRWASRLTLIVARVSIEPLMSISGYDAIHEGIEEVPPPIGRTRIWRDYSVDMPGGGTSNAVISYSTLWDSLRPKEGQRWADNPEVVAVMFRVIRHNIDHPEVERTAQRLGFRGN